MAATINTPRNAPKQTPSTRSVPEQPRFLHQLAYHEVHDSTNDQGSDKQYRDGNPISNQFVFKARKPD
ncbi:Uncharacterised protein [Escherichia coli]|uniref:Uncharacterized protein n=1 Tax=Escherichia coli TaxID=562 RepID=A0A377K316_ECOLX|nr:Uncharacterised protein [Escherichia coli]